MTGHQERTLRITDFETARSMRDVCIELSRSEAEELAAYLRALVAKPKIGPIFLSVLKNNRIEREITVQLDLSEQA